MVDHVKTHYPEAAKNDLDAAMRRMAEGMNNSLQLAKAQL
jgi:hypothetical protein